MFSIETSNQFRKDQKKLQKQKKDLLKLKTVIEILIEGKQLPQKYQDHPLSGNWKAYRDCHVENDLVLIYKIDKKLKVILLQRIGSHSELFG